MSLLSTANNYTMLLKRLDNWFQHAKQYFFTYKNGFFQLSYLANSPKAMIESFGKMPFTQFNPEKQLLQIDNVFVKGRLDYKELEEGLWLYNAKMEYKANVSFSLIYDRFIPADYYFLSYNIIENAFEKFGTKVNDVEFSNRSWSLFKPGTSVADSHFKHTTATYVTFYFNEDWLKKNLYNSDLFKKNKLNDFFESDRNYIMWPDNTPQLPATYTAIKNLFAEKTGHEVADILQLKMLTIEFFTAFFEKYKAEQVADLHMEIANNDRMRIIKVEKYLSDNLLQKFEGIDEIARKFNISPSKLKNDFKAIFGMPIFQFYQKKQMLLASELMKTDDLRIKELANKLGYENAGKFSQAFKKHFDMLPSEYLGSEN
ncbi:helix-turn-helix domain-containing protein [Ferruginibacter sp. SUN106]|uniref:helix-turn-helix domain-containing protein n=1 Tax=Ferruginibacter sp. SUN106 TaxID=2978348 RepID=UPI003D35B65C